MGAGCPYRTMYYGYNQNDLGTSDQVLRKLRCRQNADGCEARDEGRSSDYEAEERNDADAEFCRNPEGRGFPGGLLCRSACQGEWPLAVPRFAHPIPESRRRNCAGLNQRFLSTPIFLGSLS